MSTKVHNFCLRWESNLQVYSHGSLVAKNFKKCQKIRKNACFLALKKLNLVEFLSNLDMQEAHLKAGTLGYLIKLNLLQFQIIFFTDF